MHFENINAFDKEDVKKSLDKNSSSTNNVEFLNTIPTSLNQHIIESNFNVIHREYISNK